MTENSKLNNEELTAENSLKKDVTSEKVNAKAVEVLISEIKKTEYYVIELSKNKLLAKDDLVVLYHKTAYYHNSTTHTWVKAYERAAEEANGKPTRFDKVSGGLEATKALIFGKIVKRVF